MTDQTPANSASASFRSLVAPHLPALQSLAYRMVAHPEDARDIVQEALLSAYQNRDRFRGESSFRTWIFSIVTRKCLDHLRARKQWSVNAQSVGAQAHLDSNHLMAEIQARAARPGFRYEYREHIAYCFSCIGRSLPPIEAAAVLLREVFEFTNEEAAKVVDLSLSTFRHRLASGRAHMIATFQDRCALVGKQGVCWQCDGLRSHMPEARRGPPVEPLRQSEEDSDEVLFSRRLRIVREAKLGVGTTQELHDYFLRYTTELGER